MSPGGSSGGEGALIAMKGSVLGLVRPIGFSIPYIVMADHPGFRRAPISGKLTADDPLQEKQSNGRTPSRSGSVRMPSAFSNLFTIRPVSRLICHHVL